MRKAIQILVGLLFMLSVFSSYATGLVTGKVYRLLTMGQATSADYWFPVVMLNIGAGATIVGTPACNTYGEFAFSLKDASGRSMMAELLHAQSAGLNVTVVGDGTCSAWPDRERPYYIYVIYP